MTEKANYACAGYQDILSVQHSTGRVLENAIFAVSGMTCSSCASSIQKAVKRLPGVHCVAVDLLNNKAQISFYADSVNVRNNFMI